ncbi:MAG TPA: EAL domain-containing protein [Thermoleophilaceae bacterium]|nr:EAL domain-containing protein [Thermoleophilaceae bacterium]
MAGKAAFRRLPQIGLLGRFSLLSLIVTAILGVALGATLESQIRSRAIQDAAESAKLVARFGIQPQLAPAALKQGLSPEAVAALDGLLRGGYSGGSIVSIEVENSQGKVLYSNQHREIGKVLAHDAFQEAMRGMTVAAVVHDMNEVPHREALIETHAPLRLNGPDSPPDGVFEIYTRYAPVAASIRRDTTRLYLLLGVGLLLLYAALFRIVRTASQRLRRQAEENEHQARHDSLTGLPNRAWFYEQTQELLRKRRGSTAVMVMDLDRFKEVNDTLGHHAGDLLLQAAAERVRRAVRDSDVVSRLGGDEFAVVLPGASRDTAADVAGRVGSALEERFSVSGATVDVEASIGIALYPDHAEDVATLLQRADIAMYKAKENHSGHTFYSEALDHGHPSQLSLLGELRQAIEREELVLHYQPKGALSTGTVKHVEALVRWQRPEHGMVPPNEFIPLAEHTGLIRQMSAYVLDAALRQLRAWLDMGIDLGVAVNLSARNLLEADLPDQIAQLLLTRGVPAERLVLEITESAIMADPERALGVLARLSEMGIRLSIDDFGVGHSSLSYLKRLPVDEIKIDRSFVAQMDDDEDDAFIVRSTIDLGRNLGLNVVAEGVETEAVWDELAELGCDYAQGWFLGRPMPAAELAEWLRAHRAQEWSPVGDQEEQ